MAVNALVLIDGNYHAHRFYHGRPDRVGPNNQPTGVVFAFAEFFHHLANHLHVSHWALVFDHPEPSFRHTLYAPYKAQRDPMPSDLKQQLPWVRELAHLWRIPTVFMPGWEADDLMATLAKNAVKDGMEARICTPDKDLDQVIEQGIQRWDPLSGKSFGLRELQRDKGLKPEQVIDYLSMIGDTADNIPGIRGVGPKTALKLLHDYGSLNNVLEHLEDFSGKRRENLAAFAPQAELVQQLVTINAAVDGLPATDHFVRRPPNDRQQLVSWLESRGIQAQRYLIDLPPQRAPARVLGASGLLQWAERVDGPIAVFCHTNHNDPLSADVKAIGLAAGKQAVVIECQGSQWPEMRAALQSLCTKHELVAAEAGLVWRILHRRQIDARFVGDPLLCAWLQHGAAAPQTLSEYLRQRGESCHGLHVHDQCAHNAQWTLQLHFENREALAKLGRWQQVCDVELPARLALAAMEQRGLPFDVRVLSASAANLQSLAEQLLKELRHIAVRPFNPERDDHVAWLLYERCGLEDRAGQATDDFALHGLRRQHEVADLLLQYRTLSRLINDISADLPSLVSSVTGRVHARYRCDSDAVGRLVSRAPALIDVPKGTHLGRELRSAFVCGADKALLGIHLHDFRLRHLAQVSGDSLLQICCAQPRADRHFAAEICAKNPNAITSADIERTNLACTAYIEEWRPHALARRIGGDKTLAKTLMETVAVRCAELGTWRQRAIAQAQATGRVLLRSGRSIPLPELHANNPATQLMGRRLVVEALIDGEIADQFRHHLLGLQQHLPSEWHVIAQVGEELLLEGPQALQASTQDACRTYFNTIPFSFHPGSSWLEASP